MDFGLTKGYTCSRVLVHAREDIRAIYKRVKRVSTSVGYALEFPHADCLNVESR